MWREKRTKVIGPAEPATVASIKVHGYVRHVERLQSVCNTVTVTRGGSLACSNIAVGDEVGKRVRLDDQGDGDLGVLLDDSDDGCCCQQCKISITLNTHGQCTVTCRHQADQQLVHRWRL